MKMHKYLNRLCVRVLFGLALSLCSLTGHASPQTAPEESSRLNPEEKASEAANPAEEKISLDLKGIDIVELFRILSLKTGLTIVPSKEVKGRVNVFLNNLTFDDVLDVILVSQGLACERKGNIVNIMTAMEYESLYGKKYFEKRKFRSLKLNYATPSSVFAALSQIKSEIGKIIVDEASGTILLIDIPEKLELMERTARDLDLKPQTEVFELDYADSADLKEHLSAAVTKGPGQVFVDQRTNKAIVSDLPGRMGKIEQMVREFDADTQQVFIEAEIVQIVLNNKFQRGVDWEKVFSDLSLHGLDFKGSFPVSPSLSTYQELSVGTLATDDYNLVLQFIQDYGDTKILSRPRIAVVNNQEAKILVGAREAYVSQSLSQGESTTVTSESIEFIDVGVKFNVVPTINKEGFVTMKIKPEVSTVRETITTSLGSRIPIVETSEAETVVKVKDGSMIMIAGLMKDEKRDETSGVPVLSKIPLIGALFGTRSAQVKNTELIVFLTPHIISGEYAIAGTKPEEKIPLDILPEDIKESIISNKVEEIKAGQPEGLPEGDKAKTSQAIKEEKTDIDIQEKVKGIKRY